MDDEHPSGTRKWKLSSRLPSINVEAVPEDLLPMFSRQIEQQERERQMLLPSALKLFGRVGPEKDHQYALQMKARARELWAFLRDMIHKSYQQLQEPPEPCAITRIAPRTVTGAVPNY